MACSLTKWKRAALSIVSAALAACAALEPPRRAEPCYAPKAVVESYLQQVSNLVTNKARTGVLKTGEQAWVSFALARDGTASEFRIIGKTRPEAGEVLLQAATAAAPFPKPPFDPSACLTNGRAQVGIHSLRSCDDTLSDAYTQSVATKIQQAVDAAGITAPAEHAKVALRIKISYEGAAGIAVHDAPSEESGEQVAAIARKLSPFETPGETIRECVADHPFFVWIGLPGLTRGPIVIPN